MVPALALTLPIVPANGRKRTPTKQKDRTEVQSFWIIGSDGRDRTYDQLINSQLLYR